MSKHNLIASVGRQVTTSDGSASLLAKRHGFKSLKALARILPDNARVLDVGAGASPFGREIALLRPDITWVNFDYSYHDPVIYQEVSAGAPDNLEHVAGDATELTTEFKPNTFDAVFSFWLLPHLSLEDTEPAWEAARAMHVVAKEGGLLSVGPSVARVSLPKLSSSPVVRAFKDEEWTADTYADMIVAATRLTRSKRYLRKYAGRSAYQHHFKVKGQAKPINRRAMVVTGLLLIVLVAYGIRRHNKRAV